jgi:hypothetical protein
MYSSNHNLLLKIQNEEVQQMPHLQKKIHKVGIHTFHLQGGLPAIKEHISYKLPL